MSTGKLHEVLAVEATLGKAADKLMKESVKTFSKENLFIGQRRTLTMFDAEKQHLNDVESSALTTTVDENLAYLVKPVAAYMDAVFQKDLTNQQAVADLIVDGKTIATSVPATFLLGLETKLGEIRKLYDSIPTLSPGYIWKLDDDHEKSGVFEAKLANAFKTEKDIEFRVVVPPTEFQKAEIRELSVNSNVGKYESTRWSGMLTPLDKAQRITRIDTLLLAVKRARQRANATAVVSGNIGEDLFAYING